MSAHYLIRLEDNLGAVLDTLQDDLGLVDNVLVPMSKQLGGQLQYIDPYGTTTFNRLQTETLMGELREGHCRVKNRESEERLKALERLASRCVSEPHLFLKFYGD